MVREDYEPTDRNKFGMASIVNLHIDIKTVGGGDYMGDVEKRKSQMQFVHTSAKASLGWCIGCRVSDMMLQLFTDPEEFVDFFKGVKSNINDYLSSTLETLEKIENEQLEAHKRRTESTSNERAEHEKEHQDETK